MLRPVICPLGGAALLVSCGGEIGGGGPGSYTAGPIAGYGSIVVGGVHHDESNACATSSGFRV